MARKNFKILKSQRKMLLEKIKDLPNIPYYVPNPDNPEGEPIAKEHVKWVEAKGSEILLKNPDAKINDLPLDPDRTYKQRMTQPVWQDHWASIKKAYEQHGDEGATAYCDQVWTFYYDLKTLPPPPKPLVLQDKNTSTNGK